MNSKKWSIKIGIGIVGLPGAGKSIVSEIAAEKKIPTIVMGDIIRQMCTAQGLEINPTNLGAFMVKIREEEGMDAVAKRTLSKISGLKGTPPMVIIDGLRNYEEVELFRKELDTFIVIAIHASQGARYIRIQNRHRIDDSEDFRIFKERDSREIATGIAKVIALADIMLINEGDVKSLKHQISKLLQLIQTGKWR